MRPTWFLRSAAILSLLLGVGHTIGRPWIPARDPLSAAVVATMKTHPMHVMGFDRTFMDFYQGFGLMLSVTLFVQALVLWICAGLVGSDPVRARQIAAIFFVANVAQTALAVVYLFTAPIVLAALVTLCLGAAVLIGSSQHWPRPSSPLV